VAAIRAGGDPPSRRLVARASRFRTETSRNCSLIAACTPITSRCGGGCNATPRKWHAVCARDSTQRTTVGGSMRPTSRVKGKWVYLYRAVDSTGATIDFLLFSQARHRGRQALSEPKPWGNRTTPLPRVINTDKDHRLPAGHRRTQSRGRSGGERIVRCGTLTTSWNRITGPSSAGSAPASIFAPSGEPGARRAGYEAMHIDSQRPGVLECGGCEGRSTAPLHSRSVCCDDLIADPTTPIFGSTTKSQHFRRTAMYSISGCTILVVMIRIKRAFTF
jgi:DDE domain